MAVGGVQESGKHAYISIVRVSVGKSEGVGGENEGSAAGYLDGSTSSATQQTHLCLLQQLNTERLYGFIFYLIGAVKAEVAAFFHG